MPRFGILHIGLKAVYTFFAMWRRNNFSKLSVCTALVCNLKECVTIHHRHLKLTLLVKVQTDL